MIVCLLTIRPGLCNGTADDALRSIILDNNGIVMVMSRMQQSWIPDLITHHTPSTRESTVEVPLARTVATACQMLLNVLVLQPEYVRSGEPTSLCDNILGVTAFGIQRLSFETFPIVFANLVVVSNWSNEHYIVMDIVPVESHCTKPV